MNSESLSLDCIGGSPIRATAEAAQKNKTSDESMNEALSLISQRCPKMAKAQRINRSFPVVPPSGQTLHLSSCKG